MVLVDQRIQAAARKTAHGGGGHGFGAVEIVFVEGEAQKVAGLQKTDDLPPPVGQQLEDADGAAGHFEHVIGTLAFAEQRLVALQRCRGGDGVERIGRPLAPTPVGCPLRPGRGMQSTRDEGFDACGRCSGNGKCYGHVVFLSVSTPTDLMAAFLLVVEV